MRAHENAVDVEEEARVSTRRSRESDSGVATGDPRAIRIGLQVTRYPILTQLFSLV
jgi:hypothetical protein